MKKKLVLFALILCTVLGAVFYFWRQHNQEGTSEDRALTVFGNVDIRQVDLGFRVDGRVEQLFFDEGDFVKAGELIASLDSEPLAEEKALKRSELSSAQAELKRLQSGFRPQEIKIARATVVERQATLNNLQTEFKRREALVDSGSVSQQSFDDIKAQRDAAKARLVSAREQLALIEEGYRKEDIAKARAQVEAGKAQLQIANTRLNDTRLYAPSAGTIFTRVLEPGAIARSGQTVVALSLSDPAWVRAYIDEIDLGKIAPGMKAEIFIDSRPDQPYQGHVGFISPRAEFTPKNVETPELRTRLVFRFRVLVDNPDGGLRQGMPATVKLRPQNGGSKDHLIPSKRAAQ